MPKRKKEERKKNPEALGVAGFTLGIISIIAVIFFPFLGIVLSLVGFFLCLKQQSKIKTRAAKIGIILNIIGLVVNIAMIIVNIVWLSPYINQFYQQQINGSLS